MNICITNGFTYENKGDAAIILGTLAVLTDIDSKAEFNIFSFTPQKDSIEYKRNFNVKNVYSNFLNPYPMQGKYKKVKGVFKLILQLTMIIIKVVCFKISKKIILDDRIRILSEAKCVAACGGGYLGGGKWNSLIHLIQIRLNTLLNKNVIILGITIEPFKNLFIEWFTNRVLSKVNIIVAREDITYSYLNKKHDNIYKTYDYAFYLIKRNKEVEDSNNNYLKIGFTVRLWSSSSLVKSGKSETYVDEYVKLFTYYKNNYNVKFVYIPQVSFHNDNDYIVAKKIIDAVGVNDFIVYENLEVYEIIKLISSCNFFVGMRMHSNIFSIIAGVPPVAIAYESKTYGIMSSVDLSYLVLDISDINYKDIIKKINYVTENKKSITSKLYEKRSYILKDIYFTTKKVIDETVL